jgi:hypothetical protein
MQSRLPHATTAASAVGTMPVPVTLNLYEGDDFFLDIAVDDTASPIDLTLYTPKSEIRSVPGSPDLLASFDVTVVDATHLRLHLSSVESTGLPQVAAWDVQITDASGVVTTLAYGQVITVRQVTM